MKGTRVRFIPEVSRSADNEVSTRSMVSSNTFWELLDEDLPAGAVSDGEGGGTTPGGTGEDDEETDDPLA